MRVSIDHNSPVNFRIFWHNNSRTRFFSRNQAKIIYFLPRVPKNNPLTNGQTEAGYFKGSSPRKSNYTSSDKQGTAVTK